MEPSASRCRCLPMAANLSCDQGKLEHTPHVDKSGSMLVCDGLLGLHARTTKL